MCYPMPFAKGMKKDQVAFSQVFFRYPPGSFILISTAFGGADSHYRRWIVKEKQMRNSLFHPYYFLHNDKEHHTIVQ